MFYTLPYLPYCESPLLVMKSCDFGRVYSNKQSTIQIHSASMHQEFGYHHVLPELVQTNLHKSLRIWKKKPWFPVDVPLQSIHWNPHWTVKSADRLVKSQEKISCFNTTLCLTKWFLWLKYVKVTHPNCFWSILALLSSFFKSPKALMP